MSTKESKTLPAWNEAGVVSTVQSPHAILRPVPIQAVTMEEGFWRRRLEANRRAGIPAFLSWLDRNDQISPFRTFSQSTDGPKIGNALEILDANQGEIWAKLEAGTEEYYRLVERTSIPFRQILDNITAAAQVRPLVIQALFMRIQGESPTRIEQEAFCDRLDDIVQAGGQIRLVQIYTVARRPVESYVSPLSDQQVDDLAEMVRRRTGLTVFGFYGQAVN